MQLSADITGNGRTTFLIARQLPSKFRTYLQPSDLQYQVPDCSCAQYICIWTYVTELLKYTYLTPLPPCKKREKKRRKRKIKRIRASILLQAYFVQLWKNQTAPWPHWELLGIAVQHNPALLVSAPFPLTQVTESTGQGQSSSEHCLGLQTLQWTCGERNN